MKDAILIAIPLIAAMGLYIFVKNALPAAANSLANSPAGQAAADLGSLGSDVGAGLGGIGSGITEGLGDETGGTYWNDDNWTF
jgi:hypothetical protein